MNLKITPYNHFAVFSSTIIGIILFVLAMYYFKFERNMTIILAIGLAVDIVPVIILHVQYWIKNINQQYVIDQNSITLTQSNKSFSFTMQEIEKIIVYLSPSLHQNSTLSLLGMESYHYAAIKLKSQNELILTCLVEPNLYQTINDIFKGVKIERKKRLFCLIV